MSQPIEPKTPASALDLAKTSSDDLAEARTGVFKRLLNYIRPYRTRLIWGIICGVLAGAFNGVLLLVCKSVFTVVLPGAQGEPIPDKYYPFKDLPIFTDFTITPPPIPDWLFVLIVCLSIPVLFLIRGVFHFLHQYCMLWINMRVLYRLRDESFTSILKQSLSFFNHVKQGEIIQTVANQTRTTADAASQLLSGIIQHPAGIISIIFIVVITDPIYTLGALVVFPLCIVPVALISRRVRKAGGREEEESEELMVTLHESFSGIRLVKANGREDFQRGQFNEASRKIVKFIVRWRKAMEMSSPMVEIVGSLGVAIGMAYAWWTQMAPETFFMLNLGLMSIYPHAKALSRMQIQLQKCLVAARKVFGYIDASPDIQDPITPTEIENCRGNLELENIDFSYTGDRKALNEVSIKFEEGKKYALVGQSGSGKSTMLSLLLRFYDPESGSISLDGVDIRNLKQVSLREQIGLVSQDTFLFHDTIRNNIRYGKLNATDAEIEEAAKNAFAHDFIMEQADGYETMLGDKGCTLSGGQQQRISIARAILRDPPILFFDEATSALDSESERAIQNALDELSKGKTVIAIAHRLSTILDSDEIVVMKEGKIIDSAPHDTLLGRCPEYKQLYELQFSENSNS